MYKVPIRYEFSRVWVTGEDKSSAFINFFIFHLFILLYIYLIRLYYYRATFKHLETNEFYVTLLTEKV